MKRINAIVVDDEIGAVHTLRGMLEEYCPMVNIIAAANTVEQGVRVAKQYRPDIVFLDIEIPPNGNGFDFLRQTEDCDFNIIFTTAYAHYAIQAINDVQPVAYLVKPYRVAELGQPVPITGALSWAICIRAISCFAIPKSSTARPTALAPYFTLSVLAHSSIIPCTVLYAKWRRNSPTTCFTASTTVT